MNGLPPRPGSRKRANLRNKSGLGRSLVNQKNKSKKNAQVSERYAMDDEGNFDKLRSVTQERPLDEFLNTAELADTDFTTERTQNLKIISAGGVIGGSDQSSADLAQMHHDNRKRLTVPRRPKWTKEMTAFELDRLEKDAFLEWRRGLAHIQDEENLLLTPFERNVDVWRQLWRVVERSDLVVQIVDARNPLFFRSSDLDQYVKEMDDGKTRSTMLLINKSDLMTASQRQVWSDYFKKNSISYAFFSAKAASGETELNEHDAENSGDTKIITVDELEKLFIENAPKSDDEKGLQIGLVGYPNVGKSSTINALIGAKKVSVSSTPGKTKHFQTIILSSQITLCDCPGLVFPNFALSNAELVCNGVLPIDQLREWHTSAALVTKRIPRFFLEAVYGISIHTKPLEEGGSGVPTAEELLRAYARARGYMKGGSQGSPDEGRAARIILKDYVNAKLLFCVPPPSHEHDSQTFNAELYTIHGLAASRQQQILAAISKQKSHEYNEQTASIDINEIDLAVEMEKLTFSQHSALSGPTVSVYGKKNEFSEESGLDDAFFSDRSFGANISEPFHKQKMSAKNNKKHFKGKK